MQYIGEDQYLMISTRGGQFYLMDTISGSILVSHTVDVTMIPIIIGDSLYLTNTKDPVRVSLETGDISAQFDNVAIVLSFQGRETLLCTNEDQLLALPVRSWEELAEIGSIWLLKTGNRTS
jgi:hypothetical protein